MDTTPWYHIKLQDTNASLNWGRTSAMKKQTIYTGTHTHIPVYHYPPCWSRWSLRPLCRKAFPPQGRRVNTDECRPSPSPRLPSPPCTPSSEYRSSPGERSGRGNSTGKHLEGENGQLWGSWWCQQMLKQIVYLNYFSQSSQSLPLNSTVNASI